MYIPDFVWGIIGTILVEIVICAGAVVLLRKGDREKEEPGKAGRKGGDDADR